MGKGYRQTTEIKSLRLLMIPPKVFQNLSKKIKNFVKSKRKVTFFYGSYELKKKVNFDSSFLNIHVLLYHM